VPCVINGVDLTHTLPTPLWVTFDDKQKAQIQEFKEIVKEHIKPDHTDFYFTRFLVARKWDMKLSTELFINAMKVRESERIDDILETFPQNYWFKTITDYWPTSISEKKFHSAKDGCPVVYERIGLVNPKLADLIPLDVLFKHHLFNVEITERENRKVVEKNGFSAGTILIEDLEDLSASHMYGKVTKLITGIAARDEVSYPESIRKVYIVNPPGVFSLVWSLIKPFIEERTQAKFSFGPAKEFKEEWDKIIGLENLPKYLGGSLEWDPPSGGAIKSIIPTQMVTMEISRRGDHVVETAVKAGQTLNVEFTVKAGKDCGFGIFVKTGKDKKDRKQVDEYKVKKIDEEVTPFHAQVTAKEDTTYIILFDNTDSMLLSREISYLIFVNEPNEKK